MCYKISIIRSILHSACLLFCVGLVITLSGCSSDNFTPAEIKIKADPNLTTGELSSHPIASFTIVLARRPSKNVSILVSSSNFNAGKLSIDKNPNRVYEPSATLVFTLNNWDSEKTVYIKGVNDNADNGNIQYKIIVQAAISQDPAYNGLGGKELSITNVASSSTDTGRIIISPTVGLNTSEDLGRASFEVSLSQQPITGQTVTLKIASSDISEGTIVPGSQVAFFQNDKWQQAITIQIIGVDDSLVDGPQIYSILISTESGDPRFNALDVDPILVVNSDNEVGPPNPADVTVTPKINLVTNEDGLSTTFSVKLTSRPAAGTSVNIGAEVSDSKLASIRPLSLSFNDSETDWVFEKIFTLTGLDDTPPLPLGDNPYTIRLIMTSTDSAYNALPNIIVTAINLDNDVAAPVAKIIVSPTQELTTTENGLPVANFDLVLNTAPTANVSITAISSDPSEGLVSTGTITFSTTNWATPQSVTIEGRDDNIIDGPINYTINMTTTSTDPAYSNLVPGPVSVINLDNDALPILNVSLYVEPAPTVLTSSADSGAGATTLQTLGYSNTAAAGKSPGPLIEAIVGQTISLSLINNSNFSHLFEAAPVYTAATAVLGGASALFSFSFLKAGIYRYGSADLGFRGAGYFGAVVIKPDANGTAAWLNGPTYTKVRNWVLSDVDTNWLSPITFDPSLINTAIYQPKYFLINGLNGRVAIDDANTRIDGIVGDVFLIRILNAGQYDQSIHFHGNHFAIISQNGINDTNLSDANIATAPTASTINVKRNSSAMILFTLKSVGIYPVHVHTAAMQSGNGVYLNGVATSITVN